MPSWLCAMSEMATSQPAWARPIAIARPMPRAAPVTSATFPSSSIGATVSEAGWPVHRAGDLDQLRSGPIPEHGIDDTEGTMGPATTVGLAWLLFGGTHVGLSTRPVRTRLVA